MLQNLIIFKLYSSESGQAETDQPNQWLYGPVHSQFKDMLCFVLIAYTTITYASYDNTISRYDKYYDIRIAILSLCEQYINIHYG